MEKALLWFRNGLALAGVLAIGVWLGAGRTAKAAGYDTSGDVEFQLTGVNESSSLLVYQPGTRTVYVYPAATTGNSSVQCSYMFHLTRPGEVIRRVPCAVPSLNP
jgi:hypothetical protein